MKKSFIQFVLITMFAVTSLFSEEVKTVKVLTIGNSFADNACTFLSQIAASVPGCKVEFTKADIGGCSFDRHAKLIKDCEADPTLKPYYKKYTLKERLQSDKWAVVTIQQVSHKSFRPESYHPYSDEVVACIKKNAPGADIVIHQTWAYAPDCKRLTGFKMTRAQMNDGLVKCYADLSSHFGGLRMFKSGEAFTASLKSNPEINLWNAKDRFHASREGCYLIGCVWVAELFDISPEKISFVPEGMKPEVAAALRKAAASVK
ncbi:MAG: DUF4886 domain-containing protein [Kiritimatiellae bacterium]|jgi:hypothetical protein|nr:DUF4886 domain-containing protein [Kiritimatiellia bacterium]